MYSAHSPPSALGVARVADLRSSTAAWLMHFLRERAAEACGLCDELDAETAELVDEVWRQVTWLAVDRADTLREEPIDPHLVPRLATYELLIAYLMRRASWTRRDPTLDHQSSSLRVLRDDVIWVWVLEAASKVDPATLRRVNRARLQLELALARECLEARPGATLEALFTFVEGELIDELLGSGVRAVA